MKIKPASRAVITFVLCIALAVPAVAWASSYMSTFYMYTNLRGATRSYNSPNLNIGLHSSSSSGGGTYTIQLWRDQIIDAKIGTITVTRNGWGSGRWTNAGAGNYYFYFYKNGDGVRVWSNDVHMYSN